MLHLWALIGLIDSSNNKRQNIQFSQWKLENDFFFWHAFQKGKSKTASQVQGH